MSKVAIEEYLKRIESGYYQVIDGRIHRKGKLRGSVMPNGYLYHKLSKGGTDEERNLITACQECNLGKSDTEIGGV